MRNTLATFATAMAFSAVMAISPMTAIAQYVIAFDDELDNYWTVEKKVAPRYPKRALNNGVMGCAAVGYIIQADGTTSEHKVLAYYPSKVFDSSARSAAKKFKYQPSERNPEKIPAITLNVFTYLIVSHGRGESEDDEENQKLLSETCANAGKKALQSSGGQ